MMKNGQVRQPGEIKAAFYDDYPLQLAVYEKIAPTDIDVCISLVISTNKDIPGALAYEWPRSKIDQGWEIARRVIALFYIKYKLPFPEEMCA